MKANEYWWIEDESELAQFGRQVRPKFNFDDSGIVEVGCPNLQYSHKDAKKLCFAGEKPVKVKLIKVRK